MRLMATVAVGNFSSFAGELRRSNFAIIFHDHLSRGDKSKPIAIPFELEKKRDRCNPTDGHGLWVGCMGGQLATDADDGWMKNSEMS